MFQENPEAILLLPQSRSSSLGHVEGRQRVVFQTGKGTFIRSLTVTHPSFKALFGVTLVAWKDQRDRAPIGVPEDIEQPEPDV